MDENDFSKLGRDIRDGIQDAVNMAMDSMDFSGLSEKISGTVDRVMSETFGTTKRYGRRERHDQRRDRNRSAVRFRADMPGGVAATLMTVFGSIGCAGFGIPALILLAIGLPLHIPVLMGLSLIGFLPLTVGSALLLKSGCSKKARIKRFDAYKRCIGSKALCAIRSLSSAVGKPEGFVCRELEALIGQGYFPEGHLDDEKTCLILDDETYQMYLQSKEQIRRASAAKAAGEQPKKAEAPKQAEVPKSKPLTEEEKQLKAAIDVGMDYIRQIRQINDELPQPVISEKLTHLEQVIGLIYLRVEKTPEKLGSLKRFTDYYLPTTLRLVVAYRDLDKVGTENAQESKAQIEKTLDTINAAFDKLLDGLYEEDRMNIQTDIAVLKTLLAQEGLTDDGLHSMDDIFEGLSGCGQTDKAGRQQL